MTDYVRPQSPQEALSLLATDGAVAMAGGTDLMGQIDRGLRQPSLLVDLQESGLSDIRSAAGGLVIGATVTLTQLAESGLLAGYDAVVSAASQAASQLLRNVGTVGGNLCQHTRCWYYRGTEWQCWLGGGDTCYAQIGDHPSTISSRATASRLIRRISRPHWLRAARLRGSPRPPRARGGVDRLYGDRHPRTARCSPSMPVNS